MHPQPSPLPSPPPRTVSSKALQVLQAPQTQQHSMSLRHVQQFTVALEWTSLAGLNQVANMSHAHQADHSSTEMRTVAAGAAGAAAPASAAAGGGGGGNTGHISAVTRPDGTGDGRCCRPSRPVASDSTFPRALCAASPRGVVRALAVSEGGESARAPPWPEPSLPAVAAASAMRSLRASTHSAAERPFPPCTQAGETASKVKVGAGGRDGMGG